MPTIKISGVVVYDVDARKYAFKSYLKPSMFENGVFKTDYTNCIFVSEHMIEVPALPDDVIAGPARAALADEEAQARIQYLQARLRIRAQRRALGVRPVEAVQ